MLPQPNNTRRRCPNNLVELARQFQYKEVQSHKTPATANKDKDKNKSQTKQRSQSHPERLPQLALENRVQRRYYGYCTEAEPETAQRRRTHQRLRTIQSPTKSVRGFVHF